MKITRAIIEARISMLEEQREQLLAQLNAVVGALQDCQHWLETAKAPTPQK